MTKNKNLFKNLSLFLCLVPMLLLSLFCLVPKNNLKGVYAADTVDVNYSFNGSNTLTFPTYFTSSNSYSSFLPFNFRVDFYTLSGVTYIEPDCTYYSGSGTAVSFHTTICSNSYTGSEISTFSLNGNSTTIYCAESVSTLRNGAFKFGVKADSGFNSNVYKIRMYLPSSYEVISANFAKPLHIVYYDSNDKRLIFEFAVQNSFEFNDRSYYVLQDLDDNTFYNEGYNVGYNNGLSDGNQEGYQSGYSAGESVGYGNGYNDGLEQSNHYSFLSLIGAVIDAPISAFTSLLNFNLLGFNMLGFVTGLLTLSLIIFIVKLILGGK